MGYGDRAVKGPATGSRRYAARRFNRMYSGVAFGYLDPLRHLSSCRSVARATMLQAVSQMAKAATKSRLRAAQASAAGAIARASRRVLSR